MQQFQTELALIHDDRIRSFVEAALHLAPAYFWTVTSSTSGKTHPPDERGPGGRVLHTKRVVRVVQELARIEDHPQTWTDFLIAAALVHDLVVNGPDAEPMDHCWREHDVGIRKLLADLAEGNHGIADPVFLLCEGHMGRWASDPQNRPPSGSLANLLHLADVIASREWVTVEPLGTQ